MNLKTFFSVASPTTLASLINDLKLAEYGPGLADLDNLARKTLVENVGVDEAAKLIEEMRHVKA